MKQHKQFRTALGTLKSIGKYGSSYDVSTTNLFGTFGAGRTCEGVEVSWLELSFGAEGLLDFDVLLQLLLEWHLEFSDLPKRLRSDLRELLEIVATRVDRLAMQRHCSSRKLRLGK